MANRSVIDSLNLSAFEGLDAFSRLPPGLHFRLFPSRSYLERGLRYFAQGRVETLRWNAKTSRLWAEVRGNTDDYDVYLDLPADDILTHDCNCPAWDPANGCKHVIAVYATAIDLFQDRSIGAERPPFAHQRNLVQGLLEQGAKPIDQRLQVPEEPSIGCWSQFGTSNLCFVSDYEVGEELLQQCGFKRSVNRWSWDHGPTELYLHPQVTTGLPQLAQACAEAGVSLVFSPEGIDKRFSAKMAEPITIRPEVAAVPFSFVLDWSSAAEIQGKLRPDLPNFDAECLWIDPEGMLFLFDDGRIVRSTGTQAQVWVERFTDLIRAVSSFHFPDFDELEFFLEREDYQNAALLWDLNVEECAPGVLQAAVSGEAVPLSLQPVAARFVLSITSDDTYEDAYCARPLLEVDGVSFDASSLLRRLAVDLAGERYDPRLWSAKRRAELLSNVLHNLFLLETQKARSACITEAVKDPLFKRLQLTRKARSCLRAVEENWIVQDTSITLLPWEGEMPGWRLTTLPRRVIAQFALALWKVKNGSDLGVFGGPILCRSEHLGNLLTTALTVGAATGVEVRFEGVPPRHVPVEMDVSAEESERLDWFELKTEIRCDTFSIPEAEWDALITGQLLLKDQHGHLIVPDLGERREAFEQLRLLSTTSHSANQAGCEVPRLQMLDWLELRRLGVAFRLPPGTEALFQSLKNFAEVPAQPLPDGMQAQLRDYQHRGFEWLEFLYAHRFGACLADDMGLGKTLQAITFLAARTLENSAGGPPNDRRPHLVVVPPSLLFNWQAEINRFCPRLQVAEYVGSDRSWDAASASSIVLTTYDILRIDQKIIAAQKFDIVIFDETQVLKNIATGRAKAARRLQRRFTLCLTGTPMENHLGEYHAIMDLAVPGLFGNARQFAEALKKGGGERLLRRAQPFVLRRTKDRILDELPPKVENDLYLEMTSEQKEIYTRTVAEVREEVLAAYADKPRQQAGIMALAALMRLRQVCISPALLGKNSGPLAPKFDYLLETLEELRNEGHAALVFSQFTKALDLLQAQLAERKQAYVRLDGSTPAGQRKKAVQVFQESPEPHVFLISLKAGGTGLNLTRASYVFHLDPWWNPAVENQASDRAHRIGQHRSVTVQRLLMRHTVEEKIQQLKVRKQALFDAIIENPAADRAVSQPLSRDDFKYLLEG